MSNVTIYHNPRCSKSRQALQLLKDNGVEPNVVEYIKDPLTKTALQDLLTKLGMTPSQLIRKSEPLYKELNPQTEADMLNAMGEHPKLIQRAIVVKGNKAVLGRPPENILELI